MTFTCYDTKDLPPNTDILSSAIGIDLKTGKVDNFSKAPGTYNECEESFRMEGTPASKVIVKWHSWAVNTAITTSISTSKDFVRLTNFNDYVGWKASNPVICDGKMMAF